MNYSFNPAHNFWIIDWLEPTARGSYRSKEFTSYSAAKAEFERLEKIGGLEPVLEGFAH